MKTLALSRHGGKELLTADSTANSVPGAERPIRRILGIDPGTATVGFGVIDLRGGDSYRYITSGVIHTPKTMTAGERLVMIRRDMMSLLEEYQPCAAAVEAIFFFKNAKTVIPVSQARGVIVESISACGVPVADYTPMQVKMCLTGYGKADKAMIQETVANLLNLSEIIKPDDAADALAIAVSHARMRIGMEGRFGQKLVSKR